MTITQVESNGDIVTLRLHGEVTIEQAGGLHAALLAALAPGKILQVDASGATRLDTAALQILVAAAAAAQRALLLASSPAWDEAFHRYGLANPYCPPTP